MLLNLTQHFLYFLLELWIFLLYYFQQMVNENKVTLSEFDNDNGYDDIAKIGRYFMTLTLLLTFYWLFQPVTLH